MAAIDGAMCELRHTCSKKICDTRTGPVNIGRRAGPAPLGASSLVAFGSGYGAAGLTSALWGWRVGSADLPTAVTVIGTSRSAKAALLFTVRPRHFQRGNR